MTDDFTTPADAAHPFSEVRDAIRTASRQVSDAIGEKLERVRFDHRAIEPAPLLQTSAGKNQRVWREKPPATTRTCSIT
jgi:hypothetical protein